jgi:hypothetical protein
MYELPEASGRHEELLRAGAPLSGAYQTLRVDVAGVSVRLANAEWRFGQPLVQFLRRSRATEEVPLGPVASISKTKGRNRVEVAVTAPRLKAEPTTHDT